MGQRADKKATLSRKPAGGALADWRDGPHPLTGRETEYTFGLVTGALGKDEPDGRPSRELQRACDGLLEASVSASPAFERRENSTGYALSMAPRSAC